MDEWRIVFYETASGRSPIRDFLRGLDAKTRERVEAAMEQLRRENVEAQDPLVKRVDGKLWELRRSSNGNIYRLMYFFYVGRQIVFVHAFQKKTQKTPQQEIELARKHMADFLRRQDDD